MCGKHGILQRVGGVFGGLAATPGQSGKLPLMAVEQLLKCTTVTRDVRREQIGITTTVGGEAGHGRRLTSQALVGTSPCVGSGGGADGDFRNVDLALACGLPHGRNPHQQMGGRCSTRNGDGVGTGLQDGRSGQQGGV